MFTPRLTVHVTLPPSYDPDGIDHELDDIMDKSDFPMQLVKLFPKFSKMVDMAPGNIYFLLRVVENSITDVPNKFRIDRRTTLSSKGHHLKIRLIPSQFFDGPLGDHSGIEPLSPITSRPTGLSQFNISGLSPLNCSGGAKLTENEQCNVECCSFSKNTVFYSFMEFLKGFR